MAKKRGRSKGSKTKGYFFRTGRGWYTLQAGKFIPLTDEYGEHLRDREAAGVKKAYDRALREVVKQELDDPGKLPEIANGVSVGEVCAAYLKHLRGPITELGPNPKGVAKTFRDRGQTLFDFCYGLPGEFFCDGDLARRKAKGDPEEKRVHQGFGTLPCAELTQAHIDEWLTSHTWKAGGRRTRLQAVRRVMNFGIERKMITANPIKGYKIPRSVSRVTYLTPAQEVEMVAAASPAFAIALKVCIRTGARFGSEFAQLERKHVRDHGDKMEWVFKPQEIKNKKQRNILITDPAIIEIVRECLKTCDGGKVFRNDSGTEWTRAMLSQNFRRAKAKIAKQKILLDEDACMYSCRHTYAKRTLEGHWTGKPTSIKTLARLMGNTVQVCIDHYLQFSEADNEGLWGAA